MVFMPGKKALVGGIPKITGPWPSALGATYFGNAPVLGLYPTYKNLTQTWGLHLQSTLQSIILLQAPPPQLRQISKVPYKSIKPVRCISRLADSNFVLGRAHPEGLMWLCPIEYSLEGACSNIKGPQVGNKLGISKSRSPCIHKDREKGLYWEQRGLCKERYKAIWVPYYPKWCRIFDY